jgi:hypothetical protein
MYMSIEGCLFRSFGVTERKWWWIFTQEGFSKNAKTYNRRDSQMVTHSSTSRPVQCLCMAERTGCPVLTDLWSYVLNMFE